MKYRITLLAAALSAASFACDKPKDAEVPAEPPPVKAEPEPETQPEPQTEPETNPSEWGEVPKDSLSPVRQAQFDKAMKAQQALAQNLVGALTQSVKENGYKESITFCSGAAPDVTEKTGKRYGLKIGRTSHKLRNPENTAPDWAAGVVASAEGGQKTFAGPHGAFGVLSPIPTSDLCVNCHGTNDKLAEGVTEALQKQYPKDEATGFASGDLRGWFWVEVPGPS